MVTAQAGPARPVPAKAKPYFARFAWCVLAYNIAVVLWGAYVRATGSGAGCGNHWPLCNGEVVPQLASVQRFIEFTHRASSGIDTFLILGLAMWAFRVFPTRHPARLGAALSTAFLVTEAILGALLVKFGLVENNASPARAFADAAHLINTLTLLGCLTLTAWWGSGRAAIRIRSRRAWLAQDLDAAANILVRLRLWHPVMAAGVAVWLAFYAFSAGERSVRARRLAWTAGGLLAAQLAAGVLNLFLLAPVWMQMLHLLLADCLWIAVVLLCATDLAVETA